MTTTQLRILLYVLLVIGGGLWFRNWLNNHDEARDNKANLGQATRTSQAAVDIAGESSQAAEDRDAKETKTIIERHYIERQQEALRNEDPEINDWSNGIIPVRLREHDREARLARERSSDIQSGASADSSKANNTRADPIPR